MNPAKRYTLGIDNGGTYIKAALFDEMGTQRHIIKMASPARNNGTGRSERDQQTLWANNCQCIRKLLKESAVNPRQIVGVAIAGQGKGLYALGKSGEDIPTAITSSDLRAKDYSTQWAADGTSEALYEITCQDLYPYQPAVILAWLKDCEPETYASIRWVLTMKDYLNFRLTGQVMSDYSNQSGSPFLDMSTLCYDKRIFDRLGIAEVFSMLPPLRWPSEICGYVTSKAATQTGLTEGTPVMVGMFDVNACMLAMGVISSDFICMITGTWSINAYVSDVPVKHHAIMFNSAYFLPGRYLIEEGSPTSAGILEWVIDVLYEAEAKEAKTSGIDLYEMLNATVKAVKPDESNVVFLPFVHGTIDTAGIGGAWLNMTASTQRAHLLRAAYEGVVFAHRWHAERLKSSRSAPFRFRLAGGVVYSPIWLQLFSDIFQEPMEVFENQELGVRGASICAGISVGFFASYEEAITQCVRISRIVKPDRGTTRIYERKYADFLTYIDAEES